MKHKGPQWFRIMSLALILLILLASPLPAFSQSCALCYTQAASATARLIAALRSGILVLVVPPMLMSVGINFHVTQVVDQSKGVHAMIPKSIFVARK